MQMVQRLQSDHQLLVSDQTVGRKLHDAGLHSRIPLRVPALRRGVNRGRRLLWAREHLVWSNGQWYSFLTSLGSDFILIREDYEFGDFQVDSAGSNHVQEVHSYDGGTIIVWAGIRMGARIDLIWIRGNMTAWKSRNAVVEPVIIPHRVQMGPQFQLMHDNARAHTARLVSTALREHDVRVMDWPAQSPDMNPIEHAWACFKEELWLISLQI